MKLFLLQVEPGDRSRPDGMVIVRARATGDGVIGDFHKEVTPTEPWKGLTFEYLSTLGNGAFEWDGQTPTLTPIRSIPSAANATT